MFYPSKSEYMAIARNYNLIPVYKEYAVDTEPLNELEKILKNYHLYKDPGLGHFVGGAVGYLGYDLVKYFDRIPLQEKELSIPEIMLYLTDLVVVFDHLLNRVKVISTVKIENKISAGKAYDISINKIDDLEGKITKNNPDGFKKSFNSTAIDDFKK